MCLDEAKRWSIHIFLIVSICLVYVPKVSRSLRYLGIKVSTSTWFKKYLINVINCGIWNSSYKCFLLNLNKNLHTCSFIKAKIPLWWVYFPFGSRSATINAIVVMLSSLPNVLETYSFTQSIISDSEGWMRDIFFFVKS